MIISIISSFFIFTWYLCILYFLILSVFELLGISKAVVSKYENSIGYPTLDTLIRIAEYFGVTTDYLLGVERFKVIDVTDLKNEEIESIHSIIREYRKYK